MGRPRSEDAKRCVVTMRLTAETRDRLAEAAAANDRSLSREIQHRLEQSLWNESSTESEPTTAFLGLIDAIISDVQARTRASWHVDLSTWAAVKEAVIRELDDRSPPVPNLTEIEAASETLASEVKTADDLVQDLRQVGLWTDEGPGGRSHSLAVGADGSPRSAGEIDFILSTVHQLASQQARIKKLLSDQSARWRQNERVVARGKEIAADLATPTQRKT